MLVEVQIVQMESPTEAGPLVPIHGYTSLVGYHPCSPALQAVCEEGWAASQVLCHLASCPGASGVWPFPAGPARVPCSACSLARERERYFCHPPGVRSPEGELVVFRESAQHYRVRPYSGLALPSHFTTCEVGLASADCWDHSLAQKRGEEVLRW